MLVLFETAAGFAIFKLKDDKKLSDVSDLADNFLTPESAADVVQLAEFHKFRDSADALAAAVAINEGTVCKSLKSTLKKVLKKDVDRKLVVLDAKLGASIRAKLPEMEIVSNSNVTELIRCIRGQMDSLIPGISEKESSAMMLGLGHNLARYKLKFSPDKVDTMVVQAVSLLDDLDKELNNYVMRTKEWYGWHFPELAKILTDNSQYIATILTMGIRSNAHKADLTSVLPEELAARVVEAAEVSMGSEVSELDFEYMRLLCEQIVDFTEYRNSLASYLTTRMMKLAPNVTVLVGELIGARLIAHAKTLMNLAKYPASTIQLIGAEKALFRALKTKKNTPKYGLIYHAELVSRASAANKGKMSRMLAAKLALGVRCDALAEETDIDIGTNCRVALTRKINFWNNGKSNKLSGQNRQYNALPHVNSNRGGGGFYPAQQDSTLDSRKRALPDGDNEEVEPARKKKKKDKTIEQVKEEPEAAADTPKEKKKKKNKNKTLDESVAAAAEPAAEEEVAAADTSKEKKKKSKKNKTMEVEEEAMEVAAADTTQEKKKKKKKNKADAEA